MAHGSLHRLLGGHVCAELRLLPRAVSFAADHGIGHGGTGCGAEEGAQECLGRPVAGMGRCWYRCRRRDHRRRGHASGDAGRFRCDRDRFRWHVRRIGLRGQGTGADDTSVIPTAAQDRLLPLDHPAVGNDGAIGLGVGAVSVDDFNAVPIEVEDGGVEVAIFGASGGGRTVGTSASPQCSGVEVSYRRRAGSGEGDVCCARLDATPWSAEEGGLGMRVRSRYGPRGFLAQEEVCIADAEADLVARLANVVVAQRLQRSQKERGRRR